MESLAFAMKMSDNSLEKIAIFTGSAHPALAQEAADYLGIRVQPSSIRRFSNDNYEVQFGTSVRKKDVFIIQPLVPPTSDHFMELCLMLDIARMSGAASIHAVIPHYSYGRSDKKDAPRISIAARLVADMLKTAGAQHMILMTLHSPQVHGFFSVPTEHLTAHSVFVDHFAKQDLSNAVVISPDIGNAKRAAKLAHSLNVPLAIGQKKRLTDETVNISGVLGDVSGKRVIIFDDEIATGGTIVELVTQLRKQDIRGATIVTTHGLFLKDAVNRLNAVPEIDSIISTNTVPLPPERRPDKLKILPVGHIFGEVIRRTVEGESVGELFEFWPDS